MLEDRLAPDCRNKTVHTNHLGPWGSVVHVGLRFLELASHFDDTWNSTNLLCSTSSSIQLSRDREPLFIKLRVLFLMDRETLRATMRGVFIICGVLVRAFLSSSLGTNWLMVWSRWEIASAISGYTPTWAFVRRWRVVGLQQNVDELSSLDICGSRCSVLHCLLRDSDDIGNYFFRWDRLPEVLDFTQHSS
jgi:hypothetical protein